MSLDSMSSKIILSKAELEALTGYEVATKQLHILRERGFTRAFIDRNGKVVLERTHYEAVTSGTAQAVGPEPKRRGANLSIFTRKSTA